ncbi:MAG: cobalamin biosynthesis protein [Candidatus Hodarchaeota archaeon]
MIDILFGEAPERLHLTVHMGKVIGFLDRRIQPPRFRSNRVIGFTVTLTVIVLFLLLSYLIIFTIRSVFGLIGYIAISAILMKMTFAIRSLDEHISPIAVALTSDNLPWAKDLLGKISRRDLAPLDEKLVTSGAVEAVSEATVDGVIAPLFYFMIFGVLGAIAYRAINTLDSMIAYKSEDYRDFGWFAAKLDSAANFIPARLTALLIILAGSLHHHSGANGWRILKRDRKKMESMNAGWPIASMAGVLNIQLKKSGHYTLGEATSPLHFGHTIEALKIMKTSVGLFVLLILIPALILLQEIKGGILL